MTYIRGKAFGILTVLLVLIIVFCVRGTVMSREGGECAQRNRFYAALEEQYLEEARRLLEDEGFKNCGVDLRWVSYEDGRREYTMFLHHRRLERMSEEDKAALAGRLSEADFHGEMCTFTYEL